MLSSAAGAVVVPGYGTLLESGWLEVTEKTVPLAGCGLKRNVRVLHLSDLHVGPDDASYEVASEAITLGLRQRPEAAFLTGDYITQGRVPDLARFGETLRRLSAEIPVFASFGNHDGGVWSAGEGGVSDIAIVRDLLEKSGIRCLHNEAAPLELPGQAINVAGIGDFWAVDFEPDRAFSSIKRTDRPTIVLSHNPDTTVPLGAHHWDLQLSGHTHGGQVVVPVIGPPYVPVSDHRFIRGLVPWRGRQVHISRGIGSILGIRINCRPEVSMLNLTAG